MEGLRIGGANRRRALWIAFGEGALVGAALGVVLGGVRLEASRELAQGTPILAAWTLWRSVMAAAVACAVLSLASTAVLAATGRS